MTTRTKALVTLAEQTAEAAEKFRAEATKHSYLHVADLPSLITKAEHTVDNLAHFLGAYTELVRQTYAYSFQDITPHTKDTDLTGRADAVAKLVATAAQRMREGEAPLREASETASQHRRALLKRQEEGARGSGRRALDSMAAALKDVTYDLARAAYGIRFERLTVAEHETIVGNLLAALDTLRMRGSGSSGHLAHITYRAYSGTSVENDAHQAAVPFGTFAQTVGRTIAALRVLHVELVGTGRDITAAAKAQV